MTVKIEGNELVIRIEMETNPQPSASGKTLIVATTHGPCPTAAVVKNQGVMVNLNAYIRNPARVS